MRKKHSPGCSKTECCFGDDTPCAGLEDDFERADNASLGSDWTAANWSIDTNRATTTTASATAITVDDGDSPNGIVRVAFIGEDYGDTFRVIVGWTDADNYLFMEATLADAPGECGVVTLYKRESGVESQLGLPRYVSDFEPDLLHDLFLCRNDNVLVGGVDRGSEATTTAYDELDPSSFAGLKAGFASGATITSAVYADDFAHHYHQSDDKPTCGTCGVSTDCAYFFDEFDRLDVGCDWDVLSGTVAIDDDAMKITTANAVVRLRQPHPEGVFRSIVNVAITRAGEGTVRVLFNVVDDENYWYCEFYFDASVGNGANDEFRIGKCVEGVEELLNSRDAVGELTGFRVMLEPGMARICNVVVRPFGGDHLFRRNATGMVNGNPSTNPYSLTQAIDSPIESLYLGVGTGATVDGGGTLIDAVEVEFGNTLETPYHSECFNCPPECYPCTGEDAPSSLQVILNFGKPTDGTYLLDYASTALGLNYYFNIGATVCGYGPRTITSGSLSYTLRAAIWQGERATNDFVRLVVLEIRKVGEGWGPPNNFWVAELELGNATDAPMDCLTIDADVAFDPGASPPPEFPATINVQAVP